MMKSKATLFEDDEDDHEAGDLHINKAYAAKYEEWRRGEEIERLKNRLGEDGIQSTDSESSSDDDYVEPDNPEFDHDFLITLGALHKKELISEGDKFFPGDYRKKDKTKDNKEKAMTIKDYQQHIIVDRHGELDDDGGGGGYGHGREEFPREEHVTKFEDDVSSDDDDGLLTSGLFKLKSKTSENKKGQPNEVFDDAIAFVKGESSSISNINDKNLLEGVKEAWSDPKLSREDKWLADFFLNKRYLDDEDESIEREYNEIVIDEETLSEDEETLQTMETFETKYRFRYEEPDEEFIKKYPRIIEDSVRPKDERRKLHREALKQRKLQEKELKKQEIQKLKALKYKEIEAKIEKIKQASGNDDIDFGDNELEDDFDPDAHDSAMSRMFGENYYSVDDGNTEKPVFSDDDDIIKDYDDWLEKEGRNSSGGGKLGNFCEEDEDGEWGDTEDFNMDADYDEASQSKNELQQMVNPSRKNCRRKSKFGKALAKKKPVFNPKDKNFDSYFDEYYQLNFEDIVGGMPCRFQYREVAPNNFGLSTEEILTAQDMELNKWFSLKKMLKYDRNQQKEHQDNSNYSHRASLLRVKQKILPSLFTEDPEDLQVAEQEKKRIKNLKKKLRRQQRQESTVVDIESHPSLKPREKHELLSDREKTTSNKRPLEDANEGLKKRKKEKADILDSPKTKKKKHMQMEADGKKENETLVSNEKTNDNLNEKRKKKKQTDNSGETVSLVNKETTTVPDKQASNNSCSTNGPTDKNEPESLVTSSIKKLKKKKKKKKKPDSIPTVIPLASKKLKRTQTSCKTESTFFHGISDARLSAYGENPKKMKNKVKYGKKNKRIL